MDLQRVNPLDHPDWDDQLLAGGDSSFFHSAPWARVIVDSYGYKPVYFVGRDGAGLSSVIPFMDISSRLTGRRGVSLPFTDCCDPFGLNKGSMRDVVQAVIGYGRLSKWAYIEWRTTQDFVDEVSPSETYLIHDLDLDRTEPEIFSRLAESNRRNIRKAAKDGVDVRVDHSPDALKAFYRLHCQTRKHHGLPPQPFLFFENIRAHVFSKNLGTIVSAVFSGKVIASSIFFHFGTRALFKYGASDMRHLGHRPNNLVMWEAIKWCRGRGAKSLSLGRTEPGNVGLRRFKRSWGASEGVLNYYRYDLDRVAFSQAPQWGDRSKRLFVIAPIAVLRLMGRLLYKHVG